MNVFEYPLDVLCFEQPERCSRQIYSLLALTCSRSREHLLGVGAAASWGHSDRWEKQEMSKKQNDEYNATNEIRNREHLPQTNMQ